MHHAALQVQDQSNTVTPEEKDRQSLQSGHAHQDGSMQGHLSVTSPVRTGKENLPAAGVSTPTSSKMAEILSNHLMCPICQDWLLACHTLSCGHMFCGLCLATWLSQNQSCPSCRKPVAGMPDQKMLSLCQMLCLCKHWCKSLP